MYYNIQNKKSQAKNEGAGVFFAGSAGEQPAGENGLAPSFVFCVSCIPPQNPFSPKNSSVNLVFDGKIVSW